MHSACWDHSVNQDGKRIGIIGNGSTSVQIVPQLQKVAKKLKVYMRSSTWISPPFRASALTTVQRGQDVDPGQRQYEFLEKQIREHGQQWLKEEEEEQKKMMEAQVRDMKKGGFFGWFGGKKE